MVSGACTVHGPHRLNGVVEVGDVGRVKSQEELFYSVSREERGKVEVEEDVNMVVCGSKWIDEVLEDGVVNRGIRKSAELAGEADCDALRGSIGWWRGMYRNR